jgi:hypothetical protein
MSRPLNIKPGDKFNHLTFLEESDIKFSKDWIKIKYGMFECDCGKTKEMMIHNVKHGNTLSCGCQRTGKKKGVVRKHKI